MARWTENNFEMFEDQRPTKISMSAKNDDHGLWWASGCHELADTAFKWHKTRQNYYSKQIIVKGGRGNGFRETISRSQSAIFRWMAQQATTVILPLYKLIKQTMEQTIRIRFIVYAGSNNITLTNSFYQGRFRRKDNGLRRSLLPPVYADFD